MSSPTPAGYYVYAHRRASDTTVFYIGKGKGRRAWGRTGRNAWWRHVVEKHGYAVQILRDGLTESCSLTLERALIAQKRPILVNLVDGGGGTPGWRHSAETKAKISAFNKGKVLSPTTLAAMSKANRGKTLSDEHKAKLSQAKAGNSRPSPPDHVRAKISASHMGVRPSAETLAKMSAAKVGRFVGRTSPTYDHTVRRFIHPKHGTFEGTRADFITKYRLAHGCVSSVINGRRASVKGWRPY